MVGSRGWREGIADFCFLCVVSVVQADTVDNGGSFKRAEDLEWDC